MDAGREIEALVAFEARAPGTDAERRAANHLAGRLRELGREADLEAIRVHPNWALTHLIHAVIAIVGSAVSISSPRFGLALILLASALTLADLTGFLFVVRRVTGRRTSQNVFSPEDGERPGVIVLMAHLDTGRGGVVFSPRLRSAASSLGRLLRRPIGGFGVLFWSTMAVAVCAGLRVAEIESGALTAVQFAVTLGLIVAVLALADVALSPLAPGAPRDASGVVTVLRLAERFGGDKLEHFDLWVVLTGAGEGTALGAREWVREHRMELDRQNTVVIAIDRIGAGTPRFARREGLVFPTPYHPQLRAFFADAGAEPYISRGVSDAFPVRAKGLPAIAVSSPDAKGPTTGGMDAEAVDRCFEICSEVIERIDRDVGPRLADAG